jgi:hypothetical protein
LQKQKKKKTDETYKANSKAGSTSNYKHELRKLDIQINIARKLKETDDVLR